MDQTSQANPLITIDLIKEVYKNETLTEQYDGLTKYILAKCLWTGITNNEQLLEYIKKLENNPGYKYFKDSKKYKGNLENKNKIKYDFLNKNTSEFKNVNKLIHAVQIEQNFVGRKNEIETLNNSFISQKIYITSIIGWGGFGKSVLTRQWLENLNNSGSNSSEKVLWWSFYQNTSLEAFLEIALSHFTLNFKHENLPKNIETKFDILISQMAKLRCILILDGFEEMQYHERGDYFGKCKEYLLANFLRRINEGECSQSFCIVTSRINITDLNSSIGNTHILIDLENTPLKIDESRTLLRKYGIVGNDALLDDIIIDHGSHPLALVTIATLLKEFFQGHANRFSEMPTITVPTSALGNRFKLWKIFSWYNFLLKENEKKAIQVISTFRQYAPWKLIEEIATCYVNIININESDLKINVVLRSICNYLNKLRITNYNLESDSYFLHPLWKEYIDKSTPHETKQYLNKLLFDIFEKNSPNNAESLEDMQPLIEAVYHGCKCGEVNKALDIFRQKIDKKTGYLTKNLGAWSIKTDLTSMFFRGNRFSGECYFKDADKQGHLLNGAGFAQMNMGFPEKAVPLFDRAKKIYLENSLETDAAQVFRNEADALLRLGRFEEAVLSAKQAISLDPNPIHQQSGLSYLGYAQALLGQLESAEQQFDKAILLYGDDFLPPIRGIQFVETLIILGRLEEAFEKTQKILHFAEKSEILFSIAESYRVLSIVLLEKAIKYNSINEGMSAIKNISTAVRLANEAGVHYYYIKTSIDSVKINTILRTIKFKKLLKINLQDLLNQINHLSNIVHYSSYKALFAETLLIRGQLAYLTNEMEKALKDISSSMKIAEDLGYCSLKKRCYDFLENYMNTYRNIFSSYS